MSGTEGSGDMSFGGDCRYRPVSLDEENLAAKGFSRYGERYPELFLKSSDYEKSQLDEHFRSYASHLQESLAVDDDAFFLDYIRWARVFLESLHFPPAILERSLVAFSDVLHQELPGEQDPKAQEYITRARTLLSAPPREDPSFIREDNPLAAQARAYLSALVAANQEDARVLIIGMLDMGVPVRDLYRHIFQPALQETGRLWQVRKVSVAEEHYITDTTRLFIALLYNRMREESRKQARKGRRLVAASVSGEFHDIGIRMVADFFEMDGWDTLYTGANTPAPSVVAMIRDYHADAIAISATIPVHVSRVYELVQAIRADPDTTETCIIAGGYPFSLVPNLWKCIGADAGAASADEAVEKANRLVFS